MLDHEIVPIPTAGTTLEPILVVSLKAVPATNDLASGCTATYASTIPIERSHPVVNELNLGNVIVA